MLVSEPRNREMEPQTNSVRLMTVTVNENYEEKYTDDDSLYDQNDSEENIELTRPPIPSNSESESTQLTIRSSNRRPQASPDFPRLSTQHTQNQPNQLLGLPINNPRPHRTSPTRPHQSQTIPDQTNRRLHQTSATNNPRSNQILKK